MNRFDRQSWESFYNHQISESGRRMERLLGLAPVVGIDIRFDFDRGLDDLRGRLNRVLAKVEAMRRAHDDGWHNAKMHADAAFAALFEAFEQLEARFRPALVAA